LIAALEAGMRGNVLVVDDERDSAEHLSAGLERVGFQITIQLSGEEAFLVALRSDFDAVVADLSMPGMNGLELCDRLAANRPDVPVVLMTAHATVDAAVAALRAGAWDFVVKPPDLDEVASALNRAIRHRVARNEVKRLRRELHSPTVPSDVVGESPAIQRVYELIDRIADSDAPVLITGEAGTGKEVAARALHQRSPRAERPFMAVRCGALPEALLETELFGYVPGAFASAKMARTGLLQRANNGTLFLDEIGDLPLGLQAKLLRAIEERRLHPMGSDSDVPFNARIVAATHQDLEAQVHAGKFRADLLYRLNVIAFEMPPLRARGRDVLLLAQGFIDAFAARTRKNVVGLTAAAAERLLTYQWPGNIRELHNCIERAVSLTAFEQITVEDLPEKIRDYRGWQMLTPKAGLAEVVPISELERRYILHVLEVAGGSRTLAARALGMDRKTLYRRLELYGVRSNHPRRSGAGN
jgi:DNA-binding NtrC family response regulator